MTTRARFMLFVLFAAVFVACSNTPIPFASYQQEMFDQTAITSSQEKVVRLVNPSAEEPQHVRVVAFDAGGNEGNNYQIKKVVTGGREWGMKDIVVPAGGTLEITFSYTPRDLKTTRATYGGWETGQPTRYEPGPPKSAIANNVLIVGNSAGRGKGDVGRGTWDVGRNDKVVSSYVRAREASGRPTSYVYKGATNASLEVTQRALVVLTYDHPQEGVIQIELVGRAVPGPNGEISAAGGGTITKPGECAPSGTTACFNGQFSIELPGLMKAGPVVADMSGPMKLKIDGSTAELDMNTFPPVLFVVKGNGPGEPLEGKPVGAITIVISGAPDITAAGTFDSGNLQLSDVGFRIRIYLAEMSLEAAETTTAPVDFLVTGLSLTTTKPAADGPMTMQIETTLGQNPSSNPLVDPFLSGAKIIVTMEGTLQLP